MDTSLVFRIIEEINVVSGVLKTLRESWCYFQMQILKWDLEGLDLDYVLPDKLYNID